MSRTFTNRNLLSALVITLGLVISISGLPDQVAAQEKPLGTRMLSQPAVSAKHIAFAYDRDLWVADRDGSNPRRLTSHEGTEVSPRFSPDGNWIAFTGQYNTDVYLIPVSGGSPTRLTYHPAADSVEGFTPDGASVLFSSARNVFTRRYQKLYTVSIEGGFPTELPIPNGLRASYSADGKKIAYIPIAERFQTWKNYRGGTCSRVWIYDVADHSVVMVPQPEGRCNDTDPVFIGDTVYFRSDRDGEFNLYSFQQDSKEVKRLTEYEDFHIERLTESADSIIFEQAGLLHIYQPESGALTNVVVNLKTDATETRPRFVSGSNWVRNGGIAPDGSRAVVEFRGEIVTLPAKKGNPRNLTESTGVHERSPVWSPNGKHIAYFSDAGGEYQLHIADQDGKSEAKQYKIEGHGFYENPVWSPDGKKLSYIDNSWSLYVFDIDSSESTKLVSEPHYGPAPIRGLHHSWSHDSAWLAYTVNTDALIQQAFVYDVAAGTSHAISDGLSEVGEPCFDASGDYLYFLASTDAGPVKHWFAQSNNDMEADNQIYVVVLREDGDHPLAPESDEVKVKEEEADDDEGDKEESEDDTDASADDSANEKDDEKAADKKLQIDFEGLDQRIVALPVSPASHSNLQAGNAGEIYYIRVNDDGDRSLEMFSLKDRKSTTMLEGCAGFELSADKKKLLYIAGGSWGIASAKGKIAAGSGRLAVNDISVKIDPRAEWQQIFDEVWRVNRDFFYDPGMHGADWPAMKEKYQPFLKHCITRNDANRVYRWMCSEVAVGHHRVGGGDIRPDTDRVPGGLLGADFETAEGRYRFKKVYGGLNWNGSLRSPLTEPGVRVKAGEYLISVNGKDLTADDNIFRHFENSSGKQVELSISANADGSDARNVTVVPIGNESALRNRDWVEGNLKKVTEATEGKVAYVYVPNTAGAGHTYFKRYFFPQTDRQALIVDERFNGGGQIADYYIDIMRRPYISHWATRYGKDFMSPTGAIHGPKVMLIDETAGSGGDMLPWMFDKLEMGTLVGRRTWGGLVGVLGFPTLMDGGSVTAPNVAIWTEEGFIVENAGVPPHVEVEQMPADVIAGRDPQLEKAIEIALEQLKENPPHEHKKPDFPIRARQPKK